MDLGEQQQVAVQVDGLRLRRRLRISGENRRATVRREVHRWPELVTGNLADGDVASVDETLIA